MENIKNLLFQSKTTGSVFSGYKNKVNSPLMTGKMYSLMSVVSTSTMTQKHLRV